jgi:biopolymer transport protein TolR
MAMSTGQRGSLTNEPNVTPMIDVLLVLLIIFMIVIPLSRKAIDVQLPDPTPTKEPPPKNNDQIVLEIHPGGVMDINKQPVTKDGLLAKLHEVYDPRPDKIIFIKGDSAVKFQDVIWAMDVARGSGVKVIGVPPKEVDAAAAPAAAAASPGQ